MRILVAIPLYNEQKYVAQVLRKVTAIHGDVLVVDDGSTDGSGDIAARNSAVTVIRHANNLGYGQSLIDAFRHAAKMGYEWVITMDCDEQHEPVRIPDFIRKINSNEWDHVSGSRYLEAQDGDDLPPGDRRLINTKITAILNQEFDARLTDAFCGFKAHRVSALQKLTLDEPGYAFPMQLWPQIFSSGQRVTEIPVRLIYNDATRHFGGPLDDPAIRYSHYLYVLANELEKEKMGSGSGVRQDLTL